MKESTIYASKLISSAISYYAVIKAIKTSGFSDELRAKTGIAMIGIRATAIELSLKAIHARLDMSEDELKQIGHNLECAFEKLPEKYRAELSRISGYSEDWILEELKSINKNNAGVVGARYCGFCDYDGKDAVTRGHICDTFGDRFLECAIALASKVCGVDKGKTITIKNMPRE